MAECPIVPKTHFDMLDRKHVAGNWKKDWMELARECPIFHSDAHEENGFFVLTRYDDIMDVLRRPETFSSFPSTIPPVLGPRPMIPIEVDPPMHKKYREPVTSFFSRPSQVKREPHYREVAAKLVDAIVDEGSADLASAICYALPVNSIMSMLGIPDESDRQKMKNALLDMSHPPGKETDPERAAQISTESIMYAHGFFAAMLPDRRANPGDDLISLLCGIEIDGRPITDEEVLDYAILMCGAGFETTASSLAYGFALLAERPEVRQRLVDDPSLIPGFVEEVMRFETPTRGLSRTVSEDAEVGGVSFKTGDRLLLLYAAGNRDPEAFTDPEEFDIERSPNRHFGFGAGAHACVGLHMARIEMKVMFEEFLKRIPNFTIDPARITELTGPTFSVTSLPATWVA